MNRGKKRKIKKNTTRTAGVDGTKRKGTQMTKRKNRILYGKHRKENQNCEGIRNPVRKTEL